MGNELMVFYIVIIGLLISIFNIRIYKRIISDVFEPTNWYIVFLVVFFLPQIFLNNFQFHYYVSFLVFVGSLSFILGYYVNSYKILYRLNWFDYRYCKPLSLYKFIFYGITLAILLFIITLLKIKSSGVSISEYLLNMFIFHSQFGKAGGYIWLILTNPIKYLLFILIFRYLSEVKNKKMAFLHIGMIIVLHMLAGLKVSRWAYISNILFLLPILYFIFKRRRPYFRFYFIGFGLLILPIMIFLNIVRQRGVEDAIAYSENNSVIEMGLESLQGDTNPGKNFQYMVDYLGETRDYHYGKYLLTQFLFLIPRKIWHDKPVTSFCFAYTEKVMNEDPINDGTTYTFTCFDFYSIFGVLSLIIGMFLFGVFCRFLYSQFYNPTLNFFWLAFAIPFILNIINYFRGSFLDVGAFLMQDIIIIFILYKFSKYFKIIY